MNKINGHGQDGQDGQDIFAFHDARDEMADENIFGDDLTMKKITAQSRS